MRKILIATALLLASASAQAEVFHQTYTHVPAHWLLDKGPRIINVPAPLTDADRAAEDQRYAKWLDYCKPVRNVDPLGVTRLSYARRGCEFGRDAE